MSVTRRELFEHLIVLRAQEAPVPCVDLPAEDAALWTSERAADWRLAARICGGCAGLTPCREYFIANPDEFGVYGGLTTAQPTTCDMEASA